MSKTTQHKLHEQHARWREDTAAWRFDVGEWRKELGEAQSSVDAIEIMLRDVRHALELHADAVWEEEQRATAHELTLYEESQEGRRKKTDDEWAGIHHEQAARHERLADAHARIKEAHHHVVAALRRSEEIVREAADALRRTGTD